jgi:hypothetical protein
MANGEWRLAPRHRGHQARRIPSDLSTAGGDAEQKVKTERRFHKFIAMQETFQERGIPQCAALQSLEEFWASLQILRYVTFARPPARPQEF